MNYQSYIEYHKRGDAGVEERVIASLCKRLYLNPWESFKLIYFYTMTYHIPSALRLLLRPADTTQRDLHFRTDRRYVRCKGAYNRLLSELTPGMLEALQGCTTTQDAYDVVRKWYFFGRYAAFLFLEVYCNCFNPCWQDNLKFNWESDENYTKGAVHVIGTCDREALDAFLERAKQDTADNCFAIETSLCAVAKFLKGTRWDGYYTERLLHEVSQSAPHTRELIMSVL